MELIGTSLDTKAGVLVAQLSRRFDQGYGIGSLSPAVYDTAWVAMVSKKIDGKFKWLFPECFQYLVKTQLENGGWPTYASEVDGLLNTLAATLALREHARAPEIEGSPLPDDIECRLSKATASLQCMLSSWNVESTIHVGFELLVPTLLQLLEHHGVYFQFPGRGKVMSLNAQKLATFDARILYSKHPTTLIHSLEALALSIEFDRVSHHTGSDGSMMASPSSTAAYLIYSPVWNDRAEEYLRAVIRSGGGNGSGGVPSAFPITVFELTWVVSTLIMGGFPLHSFDHEQLSKIKGFLQLQLANGRGVVGFAPGLLADADDTARTILTLNLIGQPIEPEGLIAEFEDSSYFLTYRGERNNSFSANCNVLYALVSTSNPATYLSQISKTTKYLCDTWYSGKIKDKWNLSEQYSLMLLAQSFTKLLHLWDLGQLLELPDISIRNRIPIVLFQILMQTLQGQSSNGAWCLSTCSVEITAYAVLTLKAVSTLPWAEISQDQSRQAIRQGVAFLEENRGSWSQGEYTWVEKVTYCSPVLCEAYCLAALKSSASRTWGDKVRGLVDISSKAVVGFSRFFSQLPIFAKHPDWKVKAAVVEGYLFMPELKRIRLDIFPRKDMGEDKYLEYIPFTWTGSNSLHDTGLSNTTLGDMMVISMVNYQVDEYMETVVGEQFRASLDDVKAIVHELCGEPRSTTSSATGSLKRHYSAMNGEDDEVRNFASVYNRASNGSPVEENPLEEVKCVLSRFVSYSLNHPKVLASPEDIRFLLRKELATFLLAHITQAEDNLRFAQEKHPPQSPTVFASPNRTYFDWVRTTSADHTSCPYSFILFSCLMAKPGQGLFRGVRQKYLSQDLCRHLASMCRQYNDYGSIARDHAEKNLNSVNFPEFHDRGDDDKEGVEHEDVEWINEVVKKDLFWIAEYERECLNGAVSRLKKEMDNVVMDQLGVFLDVTDLYGQIYMARDIASRVK